MSVIFSVVVFALMVGALVDIITRDNSMVRSLGKGMWIVLVIFLPLVGSVLWFVLGREYASSEDSRGTFGDPRRWARPEAPVDARSDLSVRDAETELAALDREIAAHQRDERIRELEAELKVKRRDKGSKP